MLSRHLVRKSSTSEMRLSVPIRRNNRYLRYLPACPKITGQIMFAPSFARKRPGIKQFGRYFSTLLVQSVHALLISMRRMS